MATSTNRLASFPLRGVGRASRVLAAGLVSVWIITAGSGTAAAQNAANTGFRDFSYGSSATANPSGEKAQSKLWWADGIWWGSLFSPSAGRYRIHRLNLSTHQWIDTGVDLDDRRNSKADVLWDASVGKLYVASNHYSSSPTATTSMSRWGRLYRYSYLSDQDQYVLDSGFPVVITRGTAEALTIARDTNGRLWVTWVESGVVKINYSQSNDLDWATPSNLPVGSAGAASKDDISAVIAFGPNIGVMWSNQKAQKMYFAVHRDPDQPTVWQPVEDVMPSCSGPCADDHINLKADSVGQVYAVSKTSMTAPGTPLIVLSVRNTLGAWANHTVGIHAEHHTRPIVLLAEDDDKIFVFATQPESGGAIYVKGSLMSSIAFGSGVGTVAIESTTDPAINNVTSTKGPVSTASGIVVLASDPSTRRYLHNEWTGGGSTGPVIGSFDPQSGAAGTPVVISGSGFSGTTSVRFDGTAASFTVQSDTTINTTVPAGATTGRITVTNAGGTGTSATDFVVPVVGGAPFKDITFEDAALVHATSGVDRVNGPVILESASPVAGAYAARVDGASDAYLEQDFAAVDDLSVTLYLRVDALPGGSVRILQIMNSGTTVGNVVLLTTGALFLRVGSTTIGVKSEPLTIGQVYRLSVHQQRGTGADAVLQAFLAVGDEAFGAPFATLSSGGWTTAATRLRLGATVPSPVSITLDGIQLVAGGPAPAEEPQPVR